MWKSEIWNCPEPRFALRNRSPTKEYKAWLERIAQEPWVTALRSLVEQRDWWVGTEEQLFKEMKIRVGSNVRSSSDFPSKLDDLYEYMGEVPEVFRRLGIDVENWWDILAEEVEWEFDAPGWGQERPILVYQGEAALRSYYRRALELRDPLPLSLLCVVAREKAGEHKRWKSDTFDLMQALHSEHASDFTDAEQARGLFDFDREAGEYATLQERMAECAPLFDELGIHVRCEERPSGSTYWTVEVPRWKNTDTR